MVWIGCWLWYFAHWRHALLLLVPLPVSAFCALALDGFVREVWSVVLLCGAEWDAASGAVVRGPGRVGAIVHLPAAVWAVQPGRAG